MAETVNTAVVPATLVREAGGVAMTGGRPVMTKAAPELVTEPMGLVTTTV